MLKHPVRILNLVEQHLGLIKEVANKKQSLHVTFTMKARMNIPSEQMKGNNFLQNLAICNGCWKEALNWR